MAVVARAEYSTGRHRVALDAAKAPRTKRLPLVTLGWQSWSIVVIVLVILLTAAAYVLLG